jgi:NAD(P)-dependent dehydrogenase (short-subunit alcohol dehydrogenase family)
VRADVRRPEQITNMFREVKAQFGKVEIFVANARPEAAEFFAPATSQQWDTAFDSQAKAFPDRSARGECPNAGGREDNSHDIRLRKPDRRPAALGGMGSTKAAMESLVRYFAVARRETGDNCQCGQSWMDGE